MADYDADGRRVRKVSTSTTVYLDELYERVSGGAGMIHRYYVHGPDRPIAVVERTLVNEEINYLHADHLGSTDVVTQGPGSPVERRSYDAFGRRRNVIWKQPAPASFPEATTKGYTGHESDTELGLINARGRIYDPALRRFLTPDPIVAHPTLGQSYNAYSYVMNNPLGFTDPSGFQVVPPADINGVPAPLGITVTGSPPPPPTTLPPEPPSTNGRVARLSDPPPPQAKDEAINVGAVQTPGDVGTIGRIANVIVNPPVPDIQATSTGGKIVAGTAQGLVLLGYASANATLNIFTAGGWSLVRTGLGYWTAKDKTAFWGGVALSHIPYLGLVQEGADFAIAAGDGDVQGAAKKAVPVIAGVVSMVAVGRALAPKAGPVRPYEVGRFSALQGRSVVKDSLDLHHVGQAHVMEQLIPGYDRATGPAIALPRHEHTAVPTLRGPISLSPRALLARDIWNLRRYTNAPAGSLRQLIDLNKNLYPGAFKK